MKNLYKCDICGCYLDPAEGRRCEDCRKEEKQKIIKNEDGGEYDDIYSR